MHLLPASPASSLESHLGYWLRSVSNHVSSRFQALLEAQGTSVTEWVALRTLYGQEQSSHAALIAALGMTKGAASKVVSRLVEKGLVERIAVASDARGQMLVLTAAGKRAVPPLAALADQNDAHFFGHLDEQARAALMDLLRGFAALHRITAAPVN